MAKLKLNDDVIFTRVKTSDGRWTKWHAIVFEDAVYSHTVCNMLVSRNADIDVDTLDQLDRGDICQHCLNPVFLE